MGKYKFMIAAETCNCYNASTDKEYPIKGDGVPEEMEVDNYVSFTVDDFINDNTESLYAGDIPLSDMKKIVNLFMEDEAFKDWMVKKSLEYAVKSTGGKEKTIMKLASETWKELNEQGW